MSSRARAAIGAELRTSDPAGTRIRAWFEPATVADIAAAAAVDGEDLVTVTWRGQDVPAARLERCPALAEGDVVLVLVQDPQLLIVDRVIGAPPED